MFQDLNRKLQHAEKDKEVLGPESKVWGVQGLRAVGRSLGGGWGLRTVGRSLVVGGASGRWGGAWAGGRTMGHKVGQAWGAPLGKFAFSLLRLHFIQLHSFV